MDYTTEKGYICNNSQTEKFTNKKWCKINDNDVTNNSIILGKPKESNGYYWDYIKEQNTDKICMINEPQNKIKYKKCTLFDKINYLKYLFGFFLTLFITPPVLARSHLSQTLNLVNKSDVEILRFILKQFKTELKNNNVNQKDIDLISSELESEINQINASNKGESGKFLKKIFEISQNATKSQIPALGDYSTSVMDFFITHIPDENALDVLKGANFITEDNGAMYDYSKNQMKGYGRFSSHAKNATDVIQYGVTDLFADTYLHLLCGKFDYETGETVSWCQFEGAPMPPGLNTMEVFKNILSDGINLNYLQQYLDHFVDSGIYFGIKTSISIIGGDAINLALGTSEHTDKNPIYLIPFNFEKVSEEMPYQMTNQELTYTPLDNGFTNSINMLHGINTTNFISNSRSNSSSLPQNLLSNSVSNSYVAQNSNLLTSPNGLSLGKGGKSKKKRFAKKNKSKKNKSKKNKSKRKRTK
jgi:hypothetical protein